MPITGIADCCARAARGHAAAATRRVMSSRRFTAQCLRASTERDSTTGGSAAVRDLDPVDVRFGSKADTAASRSHVRFTLESGQRADLQIVPHDGASRCAAGDLLESRTHER